MGCIVLPDTHCCHMLLMVVAVFTPVEIEMDFQHRQVLLHAVWSTFSFGARHKLTTRMLLQVYE